MRIYATTSTPQPLNADQYICGRCGIKRTYKPERDPKPPMCRDCRDVTRKDAA